MLFSSAINYALRAMAGLPEDGSYCQAKDLADRLGLPGPYLAKIFRALVHGRVLDSFTGPGGGFRLARPAHHITVGEVVRILDGGDAGFGCVLGFSHCEQHDHPCALYTAWQSMAMVTIRDLSLLEVRGAKAHRRSPGRAAPGPALAGEPRSPRALVPRHREFAVVRAKG